MSAFELRVALVIREMEDLLTHDAGTDFSRGQDNVAHRVLSILSPERGSSGVE
jgi:hypothetical protein